MHLDGSDSCCSQPCQQPPVMDEARASQAAGHRPQLGVLCLSPSGGWVDPKGAGGLTSMGSATPPAGSHTGIQGGQGLGSFFAWCSLWSDCGCSPLTLPISMASPNPTGCLVFYRPMSTSALPSSVISELLLFHLSRMFCCHPSFTSAKTENGQGCREKGDLPQSRLPPPWSDSRCPFLAKWQLLQWP